MTWRWSHIEGYPTNAPRGTPFVASDPQRPVTHSQRAADVGLGCDEFGSFKGCLKTARRESWVQILVQRYLHRLEGAVSKKYPKEILYNRGPT